MRDILVVKCGGNAAVRAEAICADVAAVHRGGTPVILAHGGSADIDSLAERLGVPSRRLVAPDGVSTRYTDAPTLEVVQLALAGSVKPRLLSALRTHGVNAVGLTGLDAGLLVAARKSAHRALVDGRRIIVRDDHSGRIIEVNDDLLSTLLASGLLPVVSPPAVAEDGGAVNADADRAAAAVAGALRASTLLLLTGASGVLADRHDERSVLPVCRVPRQGAPPVVTGGMGIKLIAAREALIAGAGRVLIGDGRRPHPVRDALAGACTEVILEEE
ncbi:putative acetylglutamate kinase-like protein [Streptomyces longisporoflavus]|uniref:[LysW]-aminoadipate kinase n=1 Tax=Streptomyces longisporoflavus TaxID=28044 RepID=UPI00167CD0A2|nr:[LysW]-aminoadipate kinase [Streptomyces longisporoflavus]GGV68757.1 putative acetylglutamate kinase-like protein [Streptomyces longisporoflavus]